MGGGQLAGKVAWAKQEELARKALALDPNLADAHLSLGIARASAFDWEGGELEMKRALELNPRLALAFDQMAWLQTMRGRFDLAINNNRRAIELDPLSLMLHTNFGWNLTFAREYDKALTQFRKALDLDPNYPLAISEMGWCLVFMGETATGITAIRKAGQLDPDQSSDADLAYAYALSGDRRMAEKLLVEWDKRSKQRYSSPAVRLILYLGLGKTDKSLEWLEKCYEEQHGICWSLKVNPIYDPLRNEPRFKALLKKVGLDQ
jgi:Tfp pilus assembly protein PilF